MRKPTTCLSEYDLMFAIGGQLYRQAPNKSPRNADIIMKKVREEFHKVAYNDNEYYTYSVKDVHKYIHDLLFAIPEFVDLNLSQDEVDAGIKVDDENRSKYKFTSRYDKETAESWRDDFIDLDAFVRNVSINLHMLKDFNDDCFLCVHVKTDKCNKCKTNPDFHNQYEGERSPRGKYTFACKYDCFYHKYICCEECDHKDGCPMRCASESKTCQLALTPTTEMKGCRCDDTEHD